MHYIYIRTTNIDDETGLFGCVVRDRVNKTNDGHGQLAPPCCLFFGHE